MSAKGRAWRAWAGEALAPAVWTTGALAACIVGFTNGATAGLGALLCTLTLALMLSRLSIGWRAVSVFWVMLATQAPVVFLVAGHELEQQLGYHDDWVGFSLHVPKTIPFVIAALTSVLMASSAGHVARLGEPGWARIRAAARWTAPLVGTLATVLLAAGVVRTVRFPTGDRFFETMPVYATIPAPDDLPCEQLEPTAKQQVFGDGCRSPDVEAPPLSFHYSCSPDTREERACVLMASVDDSSTLIADMLYDDDRLGRPTPIARDDVLGVWLVRDADGRVFTVPGGSPRSMVQLHDVRERIAPPRGWMLLAFGSFIVGLGCAAILRVVRRLAGQSASAEWMSRLRGDLTIVAVGSLLVSNAALVSAALRGFLF